MNAIAPEFRVLVVVPASRPALAAGSGLAGVMVRSILGRCTGASAALGVEAKATVAGFDAATHSIFEPPAHWLGGERCHWRRYPLAEFARELRGRRMSAQGPAPSMFVFASATHALRALPGLDALVARALELGVAGVGGPGQGVHAFAMRSAELTQAPAQLARLLSLLSLRTPGGDVPALPGESDAWQLPLAQGPELSPSMRGLPGRPAFATAESPAYVNAAMAEALECPAADAPLGEDTNQLRAALIAQRETSGVRWIFNEMLNVLEYRSAHPEPASVPPEVHVAIAGRCNIECQFCSYSHKHAGRDPVTLSQLMRFQILRDIRTLRLHSGNGEPTLNRQLPELIDYVSSAHPQVAMNFFTNGTLLKPRLVDALASGHVEWISVSLNAASAAQWQRLCGVDQFQRVLDGVAQLHAAKRAHGSVTPVIYASMVLTKDSVFELPQMPALCRRLGVDRFTAIPFFSLGYDRGDRFGPEHAYHHIGAAYDALYHETMREAQRCEVSIELPPPQSEKAAAFGVETRSFRDFARVARNTDAVAHLLTSWYWPPQLPCHFLWKQAAIGIATKGQAAHPGGNYLYPCLGPLATVNFAPHTPVAFGDHDDFMATWRNRVFTRLRAGQSQPGTEPVCDACRGCDTRAPQQIPPMQVLLAEFVREHGVG